VGSPPANINLAAVSEFKELQLGESSFTGGWIVFLVVTGCLMIVVLIVLFACYKKICAWR
jgi:hypothetical protein